MKPGHTGIKRLFNAYRYSVQGIVATYRYEEGFRLETWALAIAVVLASAIADSPIEWAMMVGVVVLVMIVEILNSAIESVVDRISSEQHPLAGRAKDQGSAAVFLAMLLVPLVWMAVILS
ncbi:MAG: diacylglycerol kinase [Gammaproteobacteria bacterium]|nr:diacylglycerol kinase [Gammaproteobacteria bacterium]